MTDWSYSRSLNNHVLILERIEIWGRRQFRVWSPELNTVLLVPEADLTPVETAVSSGVERLLSVVATERIRDALAGEALAAPLNAVVIHLPHQLRALARATSGDQVRYLLADEVGLGKTIEAGLIMRELKLRGLIQRALIVVPKGLALQWVEEMRDRFHETFRLIQPADLLSFGRTPWETNPWLSFEQAIVTMDAVKPIEARRGWSVEQIARHNQTRFDDLLAAGWDLIIIDEAHRVAGSNESVARYQLGLALAAAAPYFLLLSATPHSGKSDSFLRLMNLLDQEDFPLQAELDRQRVAQYVIRTEKRRAVDTAGRPLFQPRHTRLLPIKWEAAHGLQRRLYNEVTGYVREGYNQAVLQKHNYIGFLLLLMQRLVASSTRAIRTALEKRLEILTNPQQPERDIDLDDRDWETEWLEADGQTQLEELLARASQAQTNERNQVERLLSLARQCEAAQPDAKVEALLDLIISLEREEGETELKLLIFTEFVSTQTMLSDFFTIRGYSVVCLNGSMDVAERQQVQQAFAAEVRLLISTDAGGEGLNLQCAHIAVNYDLPWSPTKIEQRIGRVDRIGQTRPVRAFNFVLADSVDHRVQEVLGEKLAIILAEFGIDKTSDILDSAEAEADFDRLYREALLHPEHVEQEVDDLMASIRRRTAEARAAVSLLAEAGDTDLTAVDNREGEALPLWLERLFISSVRADGGQALPTETGYQVRRKIGTAWEAIHFRPIPPGHEASSQDIGRLVSLDDPRIRSLLAKAPLHVPGQPIPVWAVPELAQGVTGLWSLWRVTLTAGEHRAARVFPLFLHDNGRVLAPSARFIWETLSRPDVVINESGLVDGEMAATAYSQLAELAQREGEGVFRALLDRHQARLRRDRDKGKFAFNARHVAIERIGLPNVRQKRLADLATEEEGWAEQLCRRSAELPELEAVLIVRVSPKVHS